MQQGDCQWASPGYTGMSIVILSLSLSASSATTNCNCTSVYSRRDTPEGTCPSRTENPHYPLGKICYRLNVAVSSVYVRKNYTVQYRVTVHTYMQDFIFYYTNLSKFFLINENFSASDVSAPTSRSGALPPWLPPGTLFSEPCWGIFVPNPHNNVPGFISRPARLRL